MRYSVRNKLIVFVSLILLIPCVMIGWSSYKTASKQVSDKTMEGMQRNVQVINEGIEKIVLVYKKDVEFLAQTVDASKIGTYRNNDPQLKEVFRKFKALHGEINAVGVATDQGGYVIFPNPTNLNYNPLKQSYYTLAKSNPGKIVITHPRKSPLNGKVVVTIASTTTDGHGVVAMGIPLEEWTATASEFELGEKGYIYIIDSNGKIIAHPTEELSEFAKSEPYKLVMEKESGTIDYKINGTIKREFYTTNQETGWKIIGVMDQSEIDDAIQPIFNVTIGVFIFSVLLAAMIISFIVRWITKPLTTLVKASEQVSQGDLSIRVDIKSNNEFQKVGESYNQMIGAIQKLANYDQLTNLPNRRYLMSSLNNAISRSTAENKQFALIFIDLDDFKRINDRQGHAAGDELLKAVADRLKEQIGSDGMVARFGGDEFIILMEDVLDRERVKEIVISLKQCFDKPFEVQQNLIYSKMSMGVAFFPEHGSTSEELFQNADGAMYRVKETGKNSYEFFNASSNDTIKK